MNKTGKVKKGRMGIFFKINARWRYNDLFSGTRYYWNPCLSCFLQKQEDTNHLNANENFFNNLSSQYFSFEDTIKVLIRLFTVMKSNLYNAKIMLMIAWDLIHYFLSFVAISIMCLCLDCRTSCRSSAEITAWLCTSIWRLHSESWPNGSFTIHIVKLQKG